jgi:hypothetical protein
MTKKNIIFTIKQIQILAESESAKFKKSDIDEMIGDPEDRKIEYPKPHEIESIKNDMDVDVVGSDHTSSGIDTKNMKSPPQELLDYLNKIEEAKSILSKVAAKEDDENIKNRIYSHYDKAQKLAFEMIKEFGIVH